MKKSMALMQPPEVRILKMLLSTDDPLERLSLMESAFTPGPELTIDETDYLSTCACALFSQLRIGSSRLTAPSVLAVRRRSYWR
jgi:hypothetical protein